MAYTAIDKQESFFNTKLYTGNGGTQSITGVGFQPDFTWIKNRSATENHFLQDSVRGSTKRLNSNNTNAEATEADGVTAFTSDGFNLGYTTEVNGNSNNIVSWNWKAGTTGSGTTTGSGAAKAYSYSVNTTAGFSIVKYKGNATNGHQVPHHLGVSPSMTMIKRTSGTEDWIVQNYRSGWDKRLILNTNNSEASHTDFISGVSTTTFTLQTNGSVNSNDEDYIAFVWAEKTGFSRFGTYTGNGSSDGVFVYTGFKPAFLMIKRRNSSENWHMFDIKRDPRYPTSSSYSGMATRLMANLTNASDLSQGGFRFLSNGLKMTTSWAGGNNNGDTFFYMCFGQSLVGSNDIPCTAR